MVGAIADWFAVTALFKHPLGLPIPHTALIPKRKDELGRGLEEFVGENFLQEEIIRERVAAATISLRRRALARRTRARPAGGRRDRRRRRARAEPDPRRAHRGAVPRRAGAALPRGADRAAARAACSRRRSATTCTTGWSTSASSSCTAGWSRTRTPSPRSSASGRPGGRRPGSTRPSSRGCTASWSTGSTTSATTRATRPGRPWTRCSPSSPQDLLNDPATQERTERLKERLLDHPQVLASSVSLWNALRRSLHGLAPRPGGRRTARLLAELSAFADRLLEDEPLRARLDGLAADAAVFAVERYGAEVTTVITHTIERWDGKEAARRIELHVGRDLQFIRINGTIVGGLVGVADPRRERGDRVTPHRLSRDRGPADRGARPAARRPTARRPVRGGAPPDRAAGRADQRRSRRAPTWCCGAGWGRRTTRASCATRSTSSGSSSTRGSSGRSRTWRCSAPRWPSGRAVGDAQGAGRWTGREWVEANDACRRDILEALRADGPLPTSALPDTCEVPWRSSGWNNNRNVQRLLNLMVERGEVATVGPTGRGSGCGTWPSGSTPTTRCPTWRRRGGSRAPSWRRWHRAASASCRMEPTTSASRRAGRGRRARHVAGRPGLLDQPFAGRAALLSPFDRLVFDRKRLAELFEFDYQLEMYKPADAAALGLLRAADPVRRPAGREARRDRRPQAEARWSSRACTRTSRSPPEMAAAVQAEIEDLARWLDLGRGHGHNERHGRAVRRTHP